MLTQTTDTGKIYYTYHRKNGELWHVGCGDRSVGIHYEFWFSESKISFCYFTIAKNPNKIRNRQKFMFNVKDDKFYEKEHYGLNDETYSSLLKKGYELYKLGIDFRKQRIN